MTDFKKAIEDRKQSMIWWNELSSLEKTQLCDCNTEYLNGIRRHETLTGREIAYLYQAKQILNKTI